MGMFAKVIAFLDKAAGVPAWVTHADNIRKLEERGCPTLAKAIVENEILWPLASLSLEEMVPQIAGMITIGKVVVEDKALGSEGLKQLVHEVIAATEGPVEGPLQVLYDFVDKAIPAPEVLASSEDEDLEAFVAWSSPVQEEALAALRTDQELSDAVPDHLAHMQLVQGMMNVISRGRKPGPTLKVLKTMSDGDQAIITEALEEMARRGNRLASVILEDPSL